MKMRAGILTIIGIIALSEQPLQPAAHTGIASRQGCISTERLAFCEAREQIFALAGQSSLIAVDLPSRRVIWRHPIPSGTASNVVASESVVSVSTGDNAILGIDPISGALKWKRQERSRQLAMVESTVVVQTDHHEGVIGLDASTGAVKWRHRPTTDTTPTYIDLLSVTGTQVLTNIFAMDAESGRVEERWGSGAAEVTAAIQLNGTTILARGNHLEARQSGSVVWVVPSMDAGKPSGAIVQLENNENGVIALAVDPLRRAGQLFAVSAAGLVIWREPVERPGPIAKVMDTLVVLVAAPPPGRGTVVRLVRSNSGKTESVIRTDTRLSVFTGRLPCARGLCYFVGRESGAEAVLELNLKTGVVQRVVDLR